VDLTGRPPAAKPLAQPVPGLTGSCPRVLVIAGGRVNAQDTWNNNLLLRNLFQQWPRSAIGQIFSSGDNGDEGFFGQYYRLGPDDRRLGAYFYRLKADSLRDGSWTPMAAGGGSEGSWVRALARRYLVDTGLYEVVFRPRLSKGLLRWVEAFGPDIIFAQGYSLSFATLPVMLARAIHAPIAYYPTDDWPHFAYRSRWVEHSIVGRVMARIIAASARRLVERSAVRIAFNSYMKEEYRRRYAQDFFVLMHGDSVARFMASGVRREASPDETWIVTTGQFLGDRLALLSDLDKACQVLVARGIRVRATAYAANRIPEEVVREFRHVRVEPSPTHDGLAQVLQGADVLFLPERFGTAAEGIRLSVSTKAHLFMFSGTPIIVYSDRAAGLARYASEEGWAVLLDRRDPQGLATAIAELVTNAGVRLALTKRAMSVAVRNHDLSTIQSEFARLLAAALAS